jgi:hypothetical protein
MTQQLWVVTFHFNRGHVQTSKFLNKAEAQEAVRIAVFNNEDCINCSVYRQDVPVLKNLEQIKEQFRKKLIEATRNRMLLEY